METIPLRVGASLFKAALSRSTTLLQRLRLFSSQSSSFSSAAAATRRTWGFSSEGLEDSKNESAVYHHALKFQRPSTIASREQLYNYVSFIGTVERPLKRVNCDFHIGVHTVLRVKPSPASVRSFKILLKMWNKMAEMSVEHLKQNDFIYVSGHLRSYTKTDANGRVKVYPEVIVRELNYVAQNSQSSISDKSERSESRGESASAKHKNRLYLWQVFFSSPYEWWDNRKAKGTGKLSPKHPDFKHKDTGEVLWISFGDPPWIKRQLQLHDSKLAQSARRGYEEIDFTSALGV